MIPILTLAVQSCTRRKSRVHQYFRLINKPLRARLLLAWPIVQVCPTVLSEGHADESIMRVSIGETKCMDVRWERSRAAALESCVINLIRPSPLHLRVTQRAKCYNTTDHFRGEKKKRLTQPAAMVTEAKTHQWRQRAFERLKVRGDTCAVVSRYHHFYAIP